MHVSRILAAAAAVFACACSLAAQSGFVTVSASHVSDATGGLLASGTISFAPVDNNGKPISFKVGGTNGGQVISQPVTTAVTAGVYSISLADTALTSPVNICFSVTILDNVTGFNLLGPGYTCVQPASSGPPATGSQAWCTTAGACNWDQYVPNLAGQALTQTGPAGPPGPAGPIGPTGISATVAWTFPINSPLAAAFIYSEKIVNPTGVTFQGCSGTLCSNVAGVAALGSVTLTLADNGTTFCTATIAAASTTATFSGCSAHTLAVGRTFTATYSGDPNYSGAISFAKVN